MYSIEQEVQELAGSLPISKQKILRQFLIRQAKEFGRDYIAGADEGEDTFN